MRILNPAAPLFLIAVCLLSQTPAIAQLNEFGLEIPEKDGSRELYVPGPEIKVGVALAPLPSVAEVMSDFMVTVVTLGSVEAETEADHVALFTEYTQPLTERGSFVAHLSYTSFDKIYTSGSSGDLVGKVTNHYYTLMLGSKVYYVREGHLSLYGDVMLGVTLMDPSSDTEDLAADGEQGLAFQITPLGLRIGKDLALDLSLGFGYKGVVMASANYAF
jgi:hypothetical protein